MTGKIPRPYRDPYRPVPRAELRLHAAQSWWVLPGSLSELVTSVREEGIKERIRVQRLGRRKYCIIDGKKRWQAAYYGDMTHVPITIVENMKNEDADTVWLSEYCRDRALPIVDLALTVFEFSRLFRGHYQQREIAQLVGCWPPRATMLISAGRLLQRALDTPSLSYESLRRAGLTLKYLYRLARLPEGDGGETAAVTLLADACKAGARPGSMLERLCNDLYARRVERERSRGLKDAAELEIPPETAAPGNEDDAHPGPPGVTGRELLKCLHALTLAAAPVERTAVDKVLATAGDTQEIRRMADGLGASLQLVMDKVDWLRKHLA